MSDLAAQLWELAEEAAELNQCELVDMEHRREGRQWIVRVFIDRAPSVEPPQDAPVNADGRKLTGVTLDECAEVSRMLAGLLDVKDLIPHAYQLEVSSPGIERPLKKRTDYERFAGQLAELRFYRPLDLEDGPRRKLRGVLAGLEGDAVLIREGDRCIRAPLDLIAKARLAFDD
ncbi:ribosome maturation factor RimP [Magnetofaba australis]|uniref:Ribosome maturation factor RimP n=1 Tax=Magnetofaba australis IT-1 TaxID=1434232 RepID=A0A1Y2K0T0_9PROT|nr:ribosome maturation factor RimP [Magnetofaba australis]OSM00363.1 putative ribosome maturation factor RimP [Magnetofaba australis IT-1]